MAAPSASPGECELARLFVIVGGLVVLVLTAALVGPYFVDWGSWRADFEREASKILGRQVTVRGEASARLLPFPSVTFTDVTVAGAEPGAPAMTVETFSMDAELPPLLRGEVLIFDMRLVRPVAVLSVDEGGTIDWAVRPSSPFDPSQVALEKVTITEGQALLRHAASGREHRLTEINAELSATALTGPWRIDGSLRLDGMRTAMQVSTGAVSPEGRMRLRLRAQPERYAVDVETDGEVRLDDGAAHYDGTFRVAERVAASQDSVEAGRTREPAYRVTGGFALDHRALEVSEFRMETGPLDDPYRTQGNARLSLGPDPAFEIIADGAQVRLASDETQDDGGALALPQRLAALHEALLGLPQPQIPGKVELRLPAIVAGDTMLRDIRVSAQPTEGGWTIGAASALLPGRTTLEVEGKLTSTEENFGFIGKLLLAVGQPSGFAGWLSRDVDDSIRRLPAAGFSADVDLSARRQSFDNLELILGDARFKGRAQAALPVHADPSLELELEGGRLDVDGLSAFASLFVGDQGVTRLAARDLDVKLKAGPVDIGGVTAETLDTALRLRGGVLEVDRLQIGGLEGADISATASLRDVSGPLSGSIDATLVAGDAAPLLSLLADRLPNVPGLAALAARSAVFPGLWADAEVGAVVSIQPRRDGGRDLSVSAQGDAGGGRYALTVSASGDPAKPLDSDIRLNLSAQNDEPAAILALYGLPAAPLGLLGGAATEMTVEGKLAQGAKTRLELTGEGFEASFDGTVGVGESGPFADGAGKVKTGDLEPWLATVGITLPGFGLGLPAELQARLSLNDGLLVVSGLSGSVDGGEVGGDLNGQIREGRPHLTGSLAVGEMDLGLLIGPLFGETALQGDGQGWPSAPFRAQPQPPFTAEMDVEADRLLVGPEVASRASMTARLEPDGLRLSDIKAGWRGGTVSGLADLRNNNGTGLLSAQIKLDAAPLRDLLPGAGLGGMADLGATFSGTGKTMEALVASLSGSGTARVAGLELPGVDADALAALIERADVEGTAIDAARTAIFAPPLVTAGRLAAGDAEAPLSITGGIVRTPPVRVGGDKVSLTVETRGDLNEGLLAASGSIDYAAGADAVVGSEPSLRFSAERRADGTLSAALDTEPLARFFTQRALEREQARVEAMQAQLLERQRLRREARYYAALEEQRVRAAEEQRRAAEEAQRLLEEERRRRAEEAERRAAEEAAREAALREQDAARRAADEAASGGTGRAAGEGDAIEREALPPPPAVRDTFNPDAIEQLLRGLSENRDTY